MLVEVIKGLTPEDRAILRTAGVSRQLLHAWLHGERLPTEPQAALLAIVARADRHRLQDEIALLKASPEQLTVLSKLFRRVQTKLKNKHQQPND